MSLSPLMSMGMKALAANYAALQTTGNNIANANVAGYSRQQVQLATSQGQFTGAGFFGRGVDVASVVRAHDEFLTREASAAKAMASMDSTRLAKLQQMEGVFTPGSGGLGDATNQLFAAMVDLSSQPSDLSTRQVVLARASDLASRFNEAGAALDSMQTGVTTDLKASVDQINSLAQSIASTNQRITQMRGLGQPPNDLLDERDRLIAKLSEQVQVTRVDAGDGSVGVFIGGGQRLVLGGNAAQLKVVPDGSDSTRSAVAIMDGSTARTLDDSVLGGGNVAGLLRFQNNDLVQGRNLIGQMALAMGSAFNNQQARGLTLQPPLGQVAGSALFAMGPSQALPNAGNQRNAQGNAIGSVALTITDASALKASEYDLRESTTVPGSWQLTRLSDGTVRTVNSGDVVDGMRIDIANAQSGDRFLLQPVSHAANGMSTLLSDPRDLAAASPLVATAAAANTGTLTVAGLQVTTTPLPFPGANETLTFAAAAPPATGLEVQSSLGGPPVPWVPGQPIQGANGYTLQISGVPVAGDVISVAPTSASALSSNNGNALSLVALRDAAVVDGHTATDTWAQALADVGVRTQSAKSSSGISTAVADQAEQSRSSQSGVNLDEEAAQLIQYQQSYQAAAKVLQVAQAVFDTLLQTAAR